MRKILFLLSAALPVLGMAQMGAQTTAPLVFYDMNLKPIAIRQNYTTEGSPFLLKDYCTAKVKVYKGKTYANLPANVNLMDNEVYFKLPDSEELVANVPIEWIEFNACEGMEGKKIRAGFPATGKYGETTFYEVLSDGPVKLLKHFIVNYTEQTPYNGTTLQRTYSKVPEYFLYTEKKGMVKLTDKYAALTVLADHKNQAQKYIDDQNIKVKKEEDLLRLVNYYNTL